MGADGDERPLLPAGGRTLVRLLVIAWVAGAILSALRVTTRESAAGAAVDCHWQTLPAAAEMLLGVAGAILLLRLGTEPTRVRPRVALLAVGIVAAAWALFAFAVLPRTDLVCAY